MEIPESAAIARAAADAAERLRTYFEEQSVGDERKPRRRVEGWLTKLAAVAAAFALWFLLAYNADTTHRTYVVPIEYRNLSEHLQLVDPRPTHAEVTLSGSQPAFSMLDPTAFAVSLGANELEASRPFCWLTSDHLKNLPSELNVECVAPEWIDVSFRQKTKG